MALTLRRGFKSEAERISAAVRAEIGCEDSDALDCHRLAGHYGIPVIRLEELAADGASHASINCLSRSGTAFSAMTACFGSRRLIIYNDSHPPGRLANSLAHELSHVILEHEGAAPLGLGGCRNWDAQQEGEADWLAGALLVPRDGALKLLKGGVPEASLHQRFRVSRALLSMAVRIRMSLAVSAGWAPDRGVAPGQHGLPGPVGLCPAIH